MKQQALRRFSYAVLTGPALILYALVIVVPVLVSLATGFVNWNGFGAPLWVGLANYAKIFSDPVFLWDVRNNLLIVAVSILGQIPIGFILAYIIYRKIVRAGNFFETMIFLPITISAIIVAILWNRMFSPTGVLVNIMRQVTHDPRFIFAIQEDKAGAIVPVLFVILWMYTGLYMIIFLANMQKIQQSTLEAALLDGASEWQVLRKIILPNLVGVVFTTTVFAISGSLKSFDLVFAMTAGGPARYTEVMGIYLYNNTFFYAANPYGMGGAVSTIIIVISVGLIALMQRIFGRFERIYG
jgi:multiple sugar transport system permease protein/raffinose/stachyose/melibiose transport system permease protein